MFYPAAVSGDFRACWLCASRRACCAAYESVRCTVSFPAGMTAVCIQADSLFSAACRQETLVSFCRGCAFRDSQASNAGCIRILRTRSEVLCSIQDALLPPGYLAERCRKPTPTVHHAALPRHLCMAHWDACVSRSPIDRQCERVTNRIAASVGEPCRRLVLPLADAFGLMPSVIFRLDAAAGCF